MNPKSGKINILLIKYELKKLNENEKTKAKGTLSYKTCNGLKIFLDDTIYRCQDFYIRVIQKS